MRIELNLDNHCVETEIRRIYKSTLRSCLKERRVDAHDADVIELFKKMLETVDFPRLRSSIDRILHGEKWPATLVVEEDKTPWIKIKNQRIGMDGSGQ